MAKIQDVRQLEELICETVNEYLNETECYEHPVLAVYRRCGNVKVVIDDPEKLHLPKDSETYPIAPFIRHNEDDTTEADIDEISRVANEWMFVG